VSYSQHREDILFWEYLSAFDLKNSVYVDVGANHPSDISNSYLLYRKGLRGIVVEPNLELVRLFRQVRKKDIPLNIGCGSTNTILPFTVSKTPVLSSFSESRDVNGYKRSYLPVMRLDDALQHLSFDFINLLSIDVEGMNYEVLLGAKESIQKTLLLCLEFDGEDDRQRQLGLLPPQFELIKECGCNLILKNTQLNNSIPRNARNGGG
jgi:FkbM family methyltransferase